MIHERFREGQSLDIGIFYSVISGLVLLAKEFRPIRDKNRNLENGKLSNLSVFNPGIGTIMTEE